MIRRTFTAWRSCQAYCLGIALVTVTGPAFADDLAAREAASRDVAGQLITRLGETLKKEMSTKGPESAINICRVKAPEIAGEISRANGWRVTRVSTRVRNPMLGMPDATERLVLSDFETRAGKGEKYSDMHYSEVVEEGGVHYYRFMKPIPTQPVCLTCHGDSEQIPEVVKNALDREYPLDQARGYRAGDLRGAVSIKQPMAIPLRSMAQGQ